MAGGTICGRPLEEQILMTTRTGNADMPTHQMENGRGVIECHFLPCGGFMARITTLPQQALMWIILLVARETIHGRAFESIVNVTFSAFNVDMTRKKFKDRTVMIEVNGIPTHSRMT